MTPRTALLGQPVRLTNPAGHVAMLVRSRHKAVAPQLSYDCRSLRRSLMERVAKCHCGSPRATTRGEPLLVGICHCKACQQRTGSMAASVAAFAKDQVNIEGKQKTYNRQGDSGRKVRFHFCPNCGTSLYCESDGRPGSYMLAVGAFADPNFPPPSVSIFEASKHDWMQLPTDIKRFDGAITSGS